jgi:hypothetical protein
LPFAFSLLLDKKQRETAKEQRVLSLFFQLRNWRRSRVSAENENSLAVNLQQKQQKTAKARRAPLPPVQPIFDQAASDRSEAREAERSVIQARQQPVAAGTSGRLRSMMISLERASRQGRS